MKVNTLQEIKTSRRGAVELAQFQDSQEVGIAIGFPQPERMMWILSREEALNLQVLLNQALNGRPVVLAGPISFARSQS